MTRSLTCVTLALIATFTAACSKQEAPPAAPPPMGVETLTLAEEKLPNVVELPGRIEAVRTAEVRARTNGIVLKRLYKEGTDVRQGAPLFEIDPREYRAQVQQGEAALQRAIATRTNAASVVQRYTPLLSERSVSAQEYDAALADLRQAEAQVAEARAVLDQNKLQLGFTTVRSPIDGRVGRARVTEGALVSGTESTLMTTVNQVTPVYAVFTQSNAAILDIMEKVKAGSVQIDSLQSVKVELTLDNGSPYPLTGQLDFTDQTVDPQTGSCLPDSSCVPASRPEPSAAAWPSRRAQCSFRARRPASQSSEKTTPWPSARCSWAHRWARAGSCNPASRRANASSPKAGRR